MGAAPRRAPVAVPLYVFALASGAAALGYQIVWAKQLALSFGGTTAAVSAVVAAFMGGMGAGAALYHRVLARSTSPARLYGLLELGIAASGLLLTAVLWKVPGLVARLPVEGGALTAARFGLAFALLLVPAALMGATFPALSVILIRSRAAVARHLGTLYGLNTLGAAAGAVVAGLFLVERVGLTGTAAIAAAVNAVVGLAALILARRADTAADAVSGAETVIPTALPARVTGIVLALSGLATLAYEVLWFRALTYLFGNSTYALTVMLFVFLAGLGLGPLLFPLVRRAPERVLAYCQLGAALFAVGAVGVMAVVVGDTSYGRHVSIFVQDVFDRPWTHRLLLDAGFAFLALLPATMLMGLSFPLASSLYLGDVRRLGQRLGRAVLLANAGSILGSLLAALVLLPLAGTVGGTRIVAALNLALGALVLGAWRTGGRARLVPVALTMGVGVVALVALPDRIRFAGAAGAVPGAQLEYEREGDLATVQVWADPQDPGRKAMAIDGTIIGASRGWPSVVWAKQVLIAHLPLALGAGGDALTIGLGSGSTVEALAAWSELARIDVVEINAPVVEAVSRFREAAALEDPRVHVHVDDALHFLARADRKWDLVVSDGKQAMSFSGTARLLSREFYALARDRIQPGGLFVQWVPVAIGADEFRIIVRTFTDVFADTEVFFDPPSHLVFVGVVAPGPAAFRDDVPARAAADLARLGIPTARALRARWAASGPALAGLVEGGAVNTWDRPWLEFTAYRLGPAQWRRAAAEILATVLVAGQEPSPLGARLAPAGDPVVEAARLVRMSCTAAAAGDRDRAAVLALRAVATAPDDPAARQWAERLGAPGAGSRGMGGDGRPPGG